MISEINSRNLITLEMCAICLKYFLRRIGRNLLFKLFYPTETKIRKHGPIKEVVNVSAKISLLFTQTIITLDINHSKCNETLSRGM